jgi:hypothetical protein
MADVRRVMEHYADRGWTDGLPVVPVTESYLEEFLAETDRDPGDVVFSMPHLNRTCSVRAAAINAAMAGCRPEYFPVVLAAWEAFTLEGYATKGIWQSTTGTAPLLLVNGPVRDRLGFNSRGNVFGSGFRANATVGRAIRLTAINVFGLRPHELDQATQGTPAKYAACIAENEEDSPWPSLAADFGVAADPEVLAHVRMPGVARRIIADRLVHVCVHVDGDQLVQVHGVPLERRGRDGGSSERVGHRAGAGCSIRAMAGGPPRGPKVSTTAETPPFAAPATTTSKASGELSTGTSSRPATAAVS